MQPVGPKSVFDVSDVVVLFILLLTLKIFSLLKHARLHYTGDRRCLFPDDRLQLSTAAAFLTGRLFAGQAGVTYGPADGLSTRPQIGEDREAAGEMAQFRGDRGARSGIWLCRGLDENQGSKDCGTCTDLFMPITKNKDMLLQTQVSSTSIILKTQSSPDHSLGQDRALPSRSSGTFAQPRQLG